MGYTFAYDPVTEVMDFDGKFKATELRGLLAPAGFLINDGYKDSGNDLIIRPFSADVAGVPIKKTVDTTLANALSDISSDGWYAITVNQSGSLAVLGSPATPLTGAATARPSAGGVDANYGFDKYREDLQGYYYDATTRMIMAVWIQAASNNVLYAVLLGHGSDEAGNNSRGDWEITNRKLTCRTITSGNLSTTTAVGVLWHSSATSLSWPVVFKATPPFSGIHPQEGDWKGFATQSGTVSSTVITGLGLSVQNGGNGGFLGVGVGEAAHL